MTGRELSTICKEVTREIVENLWVDYISKHMPKTEDDFNTKVLDIWNMEIWQFSYYTIGV